MGARGRRVGKQTVYTVVLSDHAKERCKQYLGGYQGVAHKISVALTSAIKLGMEPSAEPGRELGVEVYFGAGFRAECYPVDVLPGRRGGGWVVATIIPPDGWVPVVEAAELEAAATQGATNEVVSESGLSEQRGESVQ